MFIGIGKGEVYNMQEYLRDIHAASMKILQQTGIQLHHPKVLEIVQQNGIKVLDQTAYFTENQIMTWIRKAPSEFTIYARNPKYDMVIGGNHAEYNSTYGSPTVTESDGSRRPALFSDYKNLLKIMYQCDEFNINGGVLVQPSDLESTESYPVMLLATVVHSDKCIMGGPGGANETKAVMDMLGIIFGGKENLYKKPRILTVLNPSSPLQLDRTTLDTMLLYARHGQPMIVAPAVMAGTTGPVTLAGTIAQSNAESLAGIAITQMIREGTPVIYGSASSTADMRTGSFAIGAPESALCIAYCARLAKAYGFPSRGGGTLNDGKCVSVQSGYESMMTMLVTRQEGINYIFHGAGILDNYASMSFDQFMVDLEIISIVERFMSDIKTDPESLAVDVINEAGPGGEFLTKEHTYKHCRTEVWSPKIGIRGTYPSKKANEKIFANIKKKREKLLADYKKPELSPDIQSKLIDYLISFGIEPDKIKAAID